MRRVPEIAGAIASIAAWLYRWSSSRISGAWFHLRPFVVLLVVALVASVGLSRTASTPGVA